MMNDVSQNNIFLFFLCYIKTFFYVTIERQGRYKIHPHIEFANKYMKLVTQTHRELNR
jgi:hypothetical protein